MSVGGAAAAGILAALFGLVSARDASAIDPWDATIPENGTNTDNALFHGTQQVHDLQTTISPEDEDWYVLSTRPFSSYQVVVDGVTGDLQFLLTDIQRLNQQGTQVLDTAVVSDGRLYQINWHVAVLAAPATSFLRIREPAGCSTLCGDGDSYRVRLYETTYTVPRFNNSGTQSTVLLVQNVTDRICTVSHHYFDAAGTHLFTGPIASLPPYGLDVEATASVAPGASGSIRVTHTCGYGGLAGKAVSVEPSTGFTFDTPMNHRSR